MPVTRSQSKNSANQNSNLAQRNTEDSEILTKSVEQEQARRGACVEWLDFDYAINSTLTQIDWKSILRDVRRIAGCRQITFAYPIENSQRLWIIIHWRSRTHRDEFHQSDAMTQTMKEVIFSPDSNTTSNDRTSQNDKAFFIYQFDVNSTKFIVDCFSKSDLPSMVYEIWMVYLPIEEVVALLDSDPPYYNLKDLKLVNIFLQPKNESDPMAAIFEQHITWISGEVEYKGRRCKRMAWFGAWKSEEAEELYKTTVAWGSKDNGEKKLASDLFIERLNGLGMVGYETWHARFEEIKTWM
ncbi:hypothetical protein N7449_006089 [Penicillium cf. viridicatum]|uniref:ABM domain-containing protein n=1 Tax=Penicillium cf. viridicatum TaxID=2972119 RepID=A0A9W9MH99_9EURO|nr:hypothetical protein N7449_006089 [Penicillium cf. viridicatum]